MNGMKEVEDHYIFCPSFHLSRDLQRLNRFERFKLVADVPAGLDMALLGHRPNRPLAQDLRPPSMPRIQTDQRRNT